MEADWSYLNKLVLGIVQGGMLLYILVEDGYIYGSNCYKALLQISPPLSMEDLSYYIVPFGPS